MGFNLDERTHFENFNKEKCEISNKLDFHNALEKDADDIGDKIISRYEDNNMKVEILDTEIVNDGEKYIYHFLLRKGRTQKFHDLAKEMKFSFRKRRFTLFYSTEEDGKLLIVVSEKEYVPKNLIEELRGSISANRSMLLPYPVGYTIRGEPYVVDICKLPQLIISGDIDMGKSSALRSLIVSAVYRYPVNELFLFLFDIGAYSLSSVFNNLPHLAYPVIKDAMIGIRVILWIEMELKRRMTYGEEAKQFPIILCVMDESVSFIRDIADRKLAKRVTNAIESIFHLGRHAGIHMIWSTLDATYKGSQIDFHYVDSRMSFKCSDHHQSMAILNKTGAEDLEGQGSMLFKLTGNPKPVYLQGSYISPEDTKKVVTMLSETYRNVDKIVLYDQYLPDLFDDTDIADGNQLPSKQEQRDSKLCKAILWSLSRDQVSASQLMKALRIGNIAYEIIEQMTELGIVSEKHSNQPRKILPKSIYDLSDEVMTLFDRNGITEYEIRKAFRGESSHSSYNNESDSSTATPLFDEIMRKACYSEDSDMEIDPPRGRISFDKLFNNSN